MRRPAEQGITLVELLVTLAIVGVMLGVSYPSLSAGLDGLRLKTSVDRAAAFWNEARQRADRLQQPVQLTVDPLASSLQARAAEDPWRARLRFEGVSIAKPAERKIWLLYPATPSPRFELLLQTPRGDRAGLRIDVLTGVAEEWAGDAAAGE